MLPEIRSQVHNGIGNAGRRSCASADASRRSRCHSSRSTLLAGSKDFWADVQVVSLEPYSHDVQPPSQQTRVLHTRRLSTHHGSAETTPDIIFIDGGLGQLGQAESIIGSLEHNFPDKYPLLIGIAKGVTRKAGLETLILADSHEILEIDSHSPALHLIQQIRDESHRFAIMGHRQQRDKVRRTSTLEGIEGVGAKRRQTLLNHFGGLQGVKAASVDELAKLNGISKHLAETIHEALNH